MAQPHGWISSFFFFLFRAAARSASRVASSLFSVDTLPQNYATVMTTDNATFNALFHGLLNRGVYIAPALYEAGFVSAAHTDADIADTVAAAGEVFETLSK